MHMLIFILFILSTTMMNAFVSHECLCVWFGVKVCVYTLHEWSCSHYENEFVLISRNNISSFLLFSKCFVCFSVVFELLVATFQVFLFNSVGCFLLDLITTKFTLDYRRKYI
uniref:(northern house mosquito) hypothetical protein n=1 Tax=Culex pipiens TaxID=7175 RepID=A0A8D8IE44_CULPI